MGYSRIATAMRRMLIRSLPAVALIAFTAEAADHEKLMKQNLKVGRGTENESISPKTSHPRDKTPDPSLTQYIRRRTEQEACFDGWQTSCQDNPLYVSPIQTDCSAARNVFGSCVQALEIGFTASQLNELIRNCPCSCEIECGTLRPLHSNDSEDGGARTKEQDSDDDDGLCYAENRTEKEDVSTFGIDFGQTQMYASYRILFNFCYSRFSNNPSPSPSTLYYLSRRSVTNAVRTVTIVPGGRTKMRKNASKCAEQIAARIPPVLAQSIRPSLR